MDMAAGVSSRGDGVVYLGGDAGLVEALRPYLAGQGVGLVACGQAAEASQALSSVKTGLLLMDVRSASRPGRGALDVAASLREISQHGSPLRWIGLVDGEDLIARLAALRGGALACYASLPPAEELADRISDLLGVGATHAYRILVVDDQEVAALLTGGTLNRAGMVVHTVFDPMGVLNALDDFRPDLILMDQHMPGADGIELTAIIREHDDFFAMPIVIVSDEADRERQLDAMRVGANAFLVKPLDPDHLVQTVRRSVMQARSLRDRYAGAARRDASTGLWSREYFLQCIERAIIEGAASDPGLGVLYIEVRSSAGLEALRRSGIQDAVLAQVGRTLRGAADPKDTIARIGECSLAVLAKRDGATGLASSAEALRQTVSGSAMSVGGVSVELTANLGIGIFQSSAEDAITLVSRARAAMNVAALRRGAAMSASRLEGLIREALRSGGLRLLYQAVVSVQHGPGGRYEALVRLRTPDGELIQPLEFLPIAVACGLMPDIDRWVMVRVLDDMLAAREKQTGLVMMVRQTLATTASADWALWFHREIVRRNLRNRRPVLIFDLGDVAAHPDLARICFEAFERLGIDTCLNRFDGSQKAAEILRQYPWSLVRLSGETLWQMDAADLSMVVDAVHEAGAQAIGVEVESPQTIARVWGCGVDYIQGNFVQAASETLDFDFVGTELL
jgi:EAL domain-containing protein (putative c-di-GMP-specific phosphodiesterase class I)/CheY-like chemotaxis protein